MLADLVDTVVTYLNTRPSGVWGTYQIPSYVSAEPAIDPELLYSATERKLFVMPLYTNFSPEESGRRERWKNVNAQAVISIALLIPFTDFERGGDVAPWAVVKRVLDLREKIDIQMLSNAWGYTVTPDPQPPVEIQLNQRNFLSITEFTFSGQVCGG